MEKYVKVSMTLECFLDLGKDEDSIRFAEEAVKSDIQMIRAKERVIEKLSVLFDCVTIKEFKNEIVEKENSKSNVEIRLFNHKSNENFYKTLTVKEIEELEKIIEVKWGK